jgi:16S rRNA G966 N2-methylase RsmD
VVFVDCAPRSLQYLKDNIDRCNGYDECRVVKAHIPLSRRSLSRVGKYARFGLVFADPPYSRGLAEKAAVQVVSEGLLSDGAIMVLEDFDRTVMPERIEGNGLVVTLDSVRVYGQTGLWFYVAIEGE